MSGSVSESEEEFIVEKILDKNIGPGGKVQYFVKWTNYGDIDNFWAPQEDLKCPELIAEFEEKLKKKQAEKKKESEKKKE